MNQNDYKQWIKKILVIAKYLNREGIYRAKKELQLLKTAIKKQHHENNNKKS